jgi:hypothetical protein
MPAADSTDILNRLLIIHHRSLPMYLGYATPYSVRGDEKAREVLAQIVEYQKELVDRIGELIIERGGRVHHGEFPMYFTGLHDLSLDYLVRRMIADMKRDIAAIEQCVAALDDDPLAKAIAEEALGAAKGHLDSLEELVQAPAAGG